MHTKHIAIALALALPSVATAQNWIDEDIVETTIEEATDSLAQMPMLISQTSMPRIIYMPLVYNSYSIPEDYDPFAPEYSDSDSLWRWLTDAIVADQHAKRLMQNAMVSHPECVQYNVRNMAEPPRQYVAVVNPRDHTIEIAELVPVIEQTTTIETSDVKLRHWIRTFDAALQFSQSYVSPNWYQGGNNNVNMLANVYYNVKLNQALHPKWLFETTVQYKLGVNSTPDDQYRKYNISDDLFQLNSVLGMKAAKKWYYSFTAQFKTQLVNSYTKGTEQLRSAFMSPAELNLGLGMTYNTQNPSGTCKFDASISPISYNLMICTNDRLDVTSFGIDAGKHAKSTYGSSAEFKLGWQMTDNISLRSRLFGFTDYDRAYFDWENTLSFAVSKFFSTQLFFNMRYDTDTPKIDDQGKWKKLQIKEILSIGFSYKFSSL